MAREKWNDLKPHGEGRWRKSSDKRDGPTGQRSGAQRKTGLVGERQLQPYAPHGVMRKNFVKWEAQWQERSHKATFSCGGLEGMLPQKIVQIGVIY